MAGAARECTRKESVIRVRATSPARVRPLALVLQQLQDKTNVVRHQRWCIIDCDEKDCERKSTVVWFFALAGPRTYRGKTAKSRVPIIEASSLILGMTLYFPKPLVLFRAVNLYDEGDAMIDDLHRCFSKCFPNEMTSFSVSSAMCWAPLSVRASPPKKENANNPLQSE